MGEQAAAHVKQLLDIGQPAEIGGIADEAELREAAFRADGLSEEADLAFVGGQLAGENTQQGTFPCAVSAQQTHGLAGGHGEAEAVQGGHAAEAAGDVLHFQCGGWNHGELLSEKGWVGLFSKGFWGSAPVGFDAPTPRRGAGGERKAPCLQQYETTLP